jgi:molecular chaperone GrpE
MADQEELTAEEAETQIEAEAASQEQPDPGKDEATPEDADPLTQALREAVEYKDKWLRLAAEFENYKKRVARDYDSLVTSAAEGLIRQLLPTLDAVGRALDHSENGDGDSEGYQEGVRMIMEQFPKVMEGRGLTEIEALGQVFDPHVHEALMQMPTETFEAGLVSEVVERGYKLGDKVLRPSKVVVSLGPPQEDKDADERS